MSRGATGENPRKWDYAVMRALAAKHSLWREMVAEYNATTGQSRTAAGMRWAAKHARVRLGRSHHPDWDEAALRAAVAGAASWADAADRYNAATACRPPKNRWNVNDAANRLGLGRCWAPARPAAAARDELLREALRDGLGWAEVQAIYNARAPKPRSLGSLKARAYELGLKARPRPAAPKPRPAAPAVGPREPRDDPREIALRVQRLRLYKECFGIADRAARDITDEQFEEAMTGDPTTWPDPPPPGEADGVQPFRGPRVYRTPTLKGRTAS